MTRADRPPVVQQMLDAMEAQRVSGHALCRRAGYDRRIMSDLKTGKHSPRLSTLVDMGVVLGMQLAWVPLPVPSSMTSDNDGRMPADRAE